VIDLVVPADAAAGSFTLAPATALAARRRPTRLRAARRRVDGAAHLGHDLAAEDRAADAGQPRRVGDEHPHTLQFQPGDCGLNIMPLFHIHGLIAGVLAPLAAGSQVFCTPGFNALKFFAWMDEAHPTWYTAVPTMHQTIVAAHPRAPMSSRATRCASCARRRRRCRRR